jgi:class 3 adenylate cyclase/YHS domain-containing protein
MATDDGESTFLFADLAGFTALTEAMGDEQAVDVAEEFFGAVRALLPEHRTVEVKTIGDALMLRGEDADEAVRLSLRIVHEAATGHGFPLVRVGLNTGTAVEREGDWFGAAVNLAARVSGLATGGEVLLTQATREAAGMIDGVELRERGRHELRNVAEPVLLYAAVPVGVHAEEGLPIDPVCRMAVDPEQCAGHVVHDGVEDCFCSLECVGAFAAAPERYAPS